MGAPWAGCPHQVGPRQGDETEALDAGPGSCKMFYVMRKFVVCCCFFFLFVFGLVLSVPVNSYGHVGTVSSPNHTFSKCRLD